MVEVKHANRSGNGERERPRRNARSFFEHARRIDAAWKVTEDADEQKVRAIIETGRRLQDARDQLGWGRYGKLFTAPNGVKAFDQDKAERLRKIAENPALANSAHARKLPSSWYALFVLSAIPAPVLDQLIADGVVHRDLERSDAERLVASLQPNGTTTYVDRNGRFSGSAVDNRNGTTSFFDRNGSFSGSAGSSIDRAFNFNKR